jgi:hypothetical protein
MLNNLLISVLMATSPVDSSNDVVSFDLLPVQTINSDTINQLDILNAGRGKRGVRIDDAGKLDVLNTGRGKRGVRINDAVKLDVHNTGRGLRGVRVNNTF